jgi:murein L,D-transpeptidase YafK
VTKKGILIVCMLVVATITVAALETNRHSAAIPDGVSVDLITVDKSDRLLTLFSRGTPVKTYRVALGSSPVGPKQEEGDGRTPEGRYTIDSRKADSAYHRALHISYPNAADREAARRRGVSPGGDIMLHGLPNGMAAVGSLHVLHDWTKGCIAVTDEEIEEIWRVVPNGTAIDIKP